MFRFASLLLALAVALAAIPATAAELVWRPWSDELFAQAKAQRKFILLDLEAVWCHWCHVMAATTYRDPAVVALIEKHFIPVRVDQDARPDLGERYREFGWPATIVFDGRQREIVIRTGYQAPAPMAKLLAAIVRDPSPEKLVETPPPAPRPLLDAAVEAELKRAFVTSHENGVGGFDHGQKYLDRDTAEYAMLLAMQGDAAAAGLVREDLDGALALLDPAWGGANQYSTHGDWRHPHFEKLMVLQADYLRVYALAYSAFGDARYLDAARRLHGYVRRFLTAPDGSYYASQDADLVPGDKARSLAYYALDDAGRAKQGLPRIDRHRYAREAGAMIFALAQLYSATGDAEVLDEATKAAAWALRERALPGGGFSHDAKDAAGPYLTDSLWMGRGLLALYAATGDRTFFAHARAATDFVQRRFRVANGFASAAGGRLAPRPQIDENIALVRFANLLHRHTGDVRHRDMAEHALRYLAHPRVATSRLTEAGLLLAQREMQSDPLHLTVVGPRDDASARTLYRAALAFPTVYRRVEWWDRRDGPLPNADVDYPAFAKPAAYVCTANRCSSPAFAPEALVALAKAGVR